MGLYKQPELLALRRFLELEAERLARVIDAGSDSVEKVEKVAAEAKAKAGGSLDDETLEFFADEAAYAGDVRASVADLVLLATYHWVERQTKIFAKRLAKAKNSKAKVTKMNAESLANFFDDMGVKTSNVSNAAHVELLRLFANSWKHNPDEASATLLAALQLTQPPEEPDVGWGTNLIKGSLSDAAIAGAMAKTFGASDESDSEIAKVAVGVALDYLIALAAAV